MKESFEKVINLSEELKAEGIYHKFLVAEDGEWIEKSYDPSLTTKMQQVEE